MRLIVKNFGAIKDIDIEIKPLTIFIGEQATGKSTIAKLLAIFNEFDNKKDEFTVFLKKYNLANFLEENTFIKFENNYVLYKYESGVIKKIKKKKKENAINFSKETLEELKKIIRKNEAFKSFDIDLNDPETFEFISKHFINQIENIASGFSKIPVYYPAERIMISNFSDNIFNLLNNKTSIPQCIINFGHLFESARNEMENYEIPFLKNTKIFKENGRSVININDNQTLSLSQTSSGMQSVIPLALITEHYSKYKKVFFIIEEPELNLYPSTQKKLSEFFIEKCLKNDNHLIITTHSPYILTAFSNLIEAGNLANSPEATKEKLRKIIAEKYWINFDNVSAYYVANGVAKDILDKEERSIDANAIDDVSEEIDKEFNAILDLKYEEK